MSTMIPFTLLSVVDFYDKLTEKNGVVHLAMPNGKSRPIENELLSAAIRVSSRPNVEQDCHGMIAHVLKERACPDVELDINGEIKVKSLLTNQMLVRAWLADNIIPNIKGVNRKQLKMFHHLQTMGQ